ncbi:hypothetical protein PF005_g25307 [Phytophthora fragariae]|uniref:RxLR effector protein n=2 Tax=Phytophthora TaxID=4783 RepID=A0A6A3W072_9STRA|nr:hypothetical protein PF003_g36434 [Phytophthora fragariae]KAE8985778.1 hypothetical protein PR002_g22539 [Phytophthora rubi]KAE8925943.1 hypothetical protein PF009_g23858 [Phytophthora fragariae]KAE8976507.1 hypothetical protein PF011_g24022 [Phytophthora fragariae]KAE8987537.1 hypothetical protein PR001_g22297 [Phytophthora rubi]
MIFFSDVLYFLLGLACCSTPQKNTKSPRSTCSGRVSCTKTPLSKLSMSSAGIRRP